MISDDFFVPNPSLTLADFKADDEATAKKIAEAQYRGDVPLDYALNHDDGRRTEQYTSRIMHVPGPHLEREGWRELDLPHVSRAAWVRFMSQLIGDVVVCSIQKRFNADWTFFSVRALVFISPTGRDIVKRWWEELEAEEKAAQKKEVVN